MARSFKTLMPRNAFKIVRLPVRKPTKIQIAFLKVAPVVNQIVKMIS